MFPVHAYSQILPFINTRIKYVFSILKVSFRANDTIPKCVSVRKKLHQINSFVEISILLKYFILINK